MSASSYTGWVDEMQCIFKISSSGLIRKSCKVYKKIERVV